MKPTRVDVLLQWASSAEEGKFLEIVAANASGTAPDGVRSDVAYPLATILADGADERLLLELYTEAGAVQIPVEQIQAAFNAAQGGVYSAQRRERDTRSGTEGA